MLDSAILDPAILWLEERVGLETLWLFGSEARGTATSDSDIDLAALFRSPPSPSELLDARVEVGALLGRTVDLVDLDRASPILVMQVLRHGTLLVDRHPSRRVGLVAAAPGKYEDLMIVRREGERLLLERVRGGRA
ncbi:MAG: nucleotidyltransferase domain-containing protein [Chloroflexi bacterium]|nr:nucleotidyltransferase domain-containing protein [Chloroflexota bacterium]